ncbi:hypothetical protein [Duganella sp. BuS-21]|uniref:hypothetical protein n=1 Tax=Duganella sp. BuS-21 TaxID=2943848 RepID=UPI0035A7020B
MLRLWPETLQAGLFSGGCWLRRGAADLLMPEVTRLESADSDLLVSLAAMLAAHAPTLRKGSRIDVLVSDSVAMLAVLPWQEQLSTPSELHGYALACFEQQSIELTDGWTLQTAFRHHRAAGLAYAVRTDWISQLLVILQTADLSLRSVLPISAAAYLRHRPPSPNKPSTLLLSEAKRITALSYGGRCLHSVDVEPLTTGAGAGLRLVKRLAASSGLASQVSLWDAGKGELGADVSTWLPDVELAVLPRDCWSHD